MATYSAPRRHPRVTADRSSGKPATPALGQAMWQRSRPGWSVLRHLEAGDVVLGHRVGVVGVLGLLTGVYRAGLAVRVERRSWGRGRVPRGVWSGRASARLVGLT